MDELTNLMRLIDLNSEIIPEGHYLEMCNSMKKVHETLSNVNSSCDSDSDEDGIENFIMREVMRCLIFIFDNAFLISFRVLTKTIHRSYIESMGFVCRLVGRIRRRLTVLPLYTSLNLLHMSK